jgi:hypothetical protein
MIILQDAIFLKKRFVFCHITVVYTKNVTSVSWVFLVF